jgi:predicted ATP-grasp superfamily ATP-dependent carboligase
MTHLILVLDAAQRSALAVTRSLGKLDEVVIVTAEASTDALAANSRFSNEFIQSPSSTLEPERYVEWLGKLCTERHFSLVIPVTEITSQLLLMHSDRLPNVRLPFANYSKVMSLADKHELLLQAKASQVPTPAFVHFKQSDEVNPGALTYPCVIKPCLSRIYTPDGWISTSVKVLQSEADFYKALNQAPYLKQYPFMVQEFIPGSGAGVFCLYHQGRPVTFFAHRRLREKPPQGGVSVLSESIAVDPQLETYARRLLDHVNWHGVAMVEFRISPSGEPFLMEVNTRFWGSLQLSIDAGVDFPRLLMELELGINHKIPDTYQIGQRLRWLLGDLDSLYLVLRGRYSLKDKLARVCTFLIPSLRTRHETTRLGDLGPGVYEFKNYLRQLIGCKH